MTIVSKMEDFIRRHVRRILTEDGKETRSFGSTTEQIKEFGNLAETNPARIAQSFNFSNFNPSGKTNNEKAASFLRYLVGHDNDMMGIIESVAIDGVNVKVFPKKIVYGDGKVHVVPTGRIARYVGALLIAASGIGKLKFEKKDRNIFHVTGEYVIVKNV